MENKNIIDQDQQDQINETITGNHSQGTEIGTWGKEKIVNSEDQQEPLNIPDEGEPEENSTFEGDQKEDNANDQEKDDWEKKDPSENPGDHPGNDTDDSDETMHKIPNAWD